jgi:hypothetical protein
MERLQADDMCHPDISFCFTDACAFAIHMIITASVLFITQSSTFVVAKIDQIKLPKKLYRPPLQSKFREPFQETDRVKFLGVKPASCKEDRPLWKTRTELPPRKGILLYDVKRHACFLETTPSLVDVPTEIHSEIKRSVCDFWDCFEPDGLISLYEGTHSPLIWVMRLWSPVASRVMECTNPLSCRYRLMRLRAKVCWNTAPVHEELMLS